MSSSTSLTWWLATSATLTALFALDLLLLTRRRGRIGLGSAGLSVGLYVGAAVVFGLLLIASGHRHQAVEFYAGYVTEYSLSVDNLFVFLLILTRFAVPDVAREKVLLIGIVLSLGLRAAFIVSGTALIAAVSWTFCLFGLLLLLTAYRLLTGDDDEGGELKEYRTVGLLRRVLPMTDAYARARLRVQVAGQWRWTPLVLSIAAIAIANFVFALDSMPAIFGLTQDTFVIMAANAFALLGLRQLFFVIDRLLERMPFLNYGLAVILAFIGLKLVDEGLIQSGLRRIGSWELPEIGIGPSLTLIAGVLVIAMVAGWFFGGPRPEVARRD